MSWVDAAIVVGIVVLVVLALFYLIFETQERP